MINHSVIPELAAAAGRLVDRLFVPLADDLLQRYDFFALYPPDVIGRPDREFAADVLQTRVIEPGGCLPHIAWRRYERWRTVEHSCILNRMYFIVPLARECRLRRNEPLARLVVDTILDFVHSCPPPPSPDAIVEHISRTLHMQHHDYNLKTFDEIQKDETDIGYIWFDFQPASRLMHFLYVMHFLRGHDALTPQAKQDITRSIYEHAEVLYHGERDAPLVVGDNHQSTKAAALMMAAAFFHGVGQWQDFFDQASRIITFHSKKCFFPDGVLKEISPSYHTSVAWHVRDCFLLAQRLGHPLGADVRKQLSKAASYIESLTAPNGRTVVIDDGREIQPQGWLAAMTPFRNPSDEEDCRFFPNAGVASLRRSGLFLVLDGSTFTGAISHYQGGKNGISLWVDERAFLVDSGCPDLYDDELFSKWYKLPQAHSTLLIDGQGDSSLKGFTEFDAHAKIQSTGWQSAGQDMQITNTLTSTHPRWRNIQWARCLTVDPARNVTIHDQVQSDRPVLLTFIFNLHSDVEIQSTDAYSATLCSQNRQITLSFCCEATVAVRAGPGRIFTLGSHRDTRQLLLDVPCEAMMQLATTIHVPAEVSRRRSTKP